MSNRSFLLIAVSLVASGQERQTQRDFNAEKEATLSRMMAGNVRRQLKVLDSPAALEYVRRLVAGLSQHVVGQLPPLNFELVADPDASGHAHEPIVLPGGYIFLRASLFLRAEDEAEFASMVAHALGHVAKRHGLRTMSPQTTGASSIPLIFADWTSSPSLPLVWMKAVRGYEIEADALAVQIASDAGYDPEALPRYIERVQLDRPEHQKYSALPPVEERLGAVSEAIRSLSRRDSYKIGSADFTAARDEIRPLLRQYALEVAKAPSLRRKNEVDDERPKLSRP